MKKNVYCYYVILIAQICFFSCAKEQKQKKEISFIQPLTIIASCPDITLPGMNDGVYLDAFERFEVTNNNKVKYYL